MKNAALFLPLIFLSAQTFASSSLLKSHYTGATQELQADPASHEQPTMIAKASLNEVSRSEYKNAATDVVVVYLMTNDAQSSEYLAVLHEATEVNLTLDFNNMSPHGESSVVAASAQIQGDDDQFRRAEGYCLLEVDQSLECHLTPSFNAFGLLKDTSLNLSLR